MDWLRMRIGSWFFVRTKDLRISYFYPYTKKGKKYLFQPYIGLQTPTQELIIHGKRNLWAFLDSLFPDDPLPRRQINEDIKDPEIGKMILQNLLDDENAWSYLRFQVRDGEWQNPYGKKTQGTYILSASATSSDVDVTPNLMLLEGSYEDCFLIPYSFTTKTRLRSLTALVIPLEANKNSRVMVLDDMDGSHIIFSLIEANGSTFRPRKMSKISCLNLPEIHNEIDLRLKELQAVENFRFNFPELKPLDVNMRYWEMDELENKRFFSCKSYAKFRINSISDESHRNN